MRVLITGGAGYIGLELAYRLDAMEQIVSITLLDALSRVNYNVFSGLRKFSSGKIEFVEGDILDNRVLSKCIENSDVIFHMAAQVPSELGAVSPHHFEQINNWGLSNLVDTLCSHETSKLLINFSSLSVFGSGRIDVDNMEPKPTSYYAVSKLRGERHLNRIALGQNHRYMNLRLPIVFGYSKNLRIDCPINRLVFDANFKKRIRIKGEFNGSAPYVYMRDLLNYLVSILADLGAIKNGTYYPPIMQVDASSVYEVLKEVHSGVEVILLDQGVYGEELLVSGEGLTILQDPQNRRLYEALSEFNSTFTF